jgi:hypothetical protein
MNRNSIIAAAASVAVGLVASQVNAATLSWVSGNGAITDSNYTDGTLTGLAAGSADVVQIGVTGGVSVTASGGSPLSYQKLRVGHTQNPQGGSGSAINPQGPGTLTVDNGTAISLTVGAAGAGNASLWVGNVQNGTLNIDGAGSSVTAARLIEIGYGNNTARNGTVNITNGGTLTATLGNINLGEGISAGLNGVQGRLFVNGTVNATSGGADLIVGVHNATSFVEQSGGQINVNDRIEVAQGGSSNSYFKVTGGTTTAGGTIAVGLGTSTGATFTLSGTGTVSAGGRFVMGGGTATSVVMNHSAGTLTTTLDVRIAEAFTSGTSDATYNLSGTGAINSTTGMIVGRQGVGKMFQTGGTVTLNGGLSISNIAGAATPVATSGLYEISAGSLTVNNSAGIALNLGMTNAGEFRVVGDDSAIDLNGNFVVTTTGSTLAFELESGDLLSVIDVSGTATFVSGTNLVFDGTNAAPTQTVYDLLKATDVIDNGIAFSTPNLSNWGYRIVAAEGGGEILQAYLVPEPGTLGLAAMAGMMFLARRRRA